MGSHGSRTPSQIIFIAAMGMIGARLVKRHRTHQLEEGSDLKTIFSRFGLTNREQEMLELVIKGKCNKDIERELFISKSTGKNHIHNIYEKMKVKSRLELLNLIQTFNSNKSDQH